MKPKDNEPRIETDLLGSIAVPKDALYGAQTQRAILNFPVGSQRALGSYPGMVRALFLIKKSAAIVNHNLGAIDDEKAGGILQAVESLLIEDASIHFPIHALHGGGGTSANMNANEVLANRGEEILGGKRGEYHFLHPNEHVNLNQSTNDVYPTACHLAVIFQWQTLKEALSGLSRAFEQKACEFKDQRRLARTCLQDAVDISFADFFSGYSGFLERNLLRLEEALGHLYTVNLGGTIVGRNEDAPEAYRHSIVPTLGIVSGETRLEQAGNLFDAAQNADDLLAFSSRLEIVSRGLFKIGSDLRILSSGPEGGLGEIILPAVQPGSSIMPGKINPVMPEFLMQICLRVLGNHAACAAGLDHGELDLNIWESLMTFSILDSMEILESALNAFTEKCVGGLKINAQVNDQHSKTIIPRLTELARNYGYVSITAVCKEAGDDLAKLKKMLDECFPSSSSS
jgi:aspartate ammonia-lyase